MIDYKAVVIILHSFNLLSTSKSSWSVSPIFIWILRFWALWFSLLVTFSAFWSFIYSAIWIRPNVPARKKSQLRIRFPEGRLKRPQLWMFDNYFDRQFWIFDQILHNFFIFFYFKYCLLWIYYLGSDNNNYNNCMVL